MELSKKQKLFWEFFSAFLKSSWTFQHFEKKISLIAHVFPKFRTANDVVTWMYTKFRCRIPFDKQHGQRSKTLLKSAQQHLYHIYWLVCIKLSLKGSVSVISKIWILFVISLTSDGKHSLVDRDNLTQPIWIYFSKKQKKNCLIFATFLKLTSNLKHCEEKDDPFHLCISEITDCKSCCYINV